MTLWLLHTPWNLHTVPWDVMVVYKTLRVWGQVNRKDLLPSIEAKEKTNMGLRCKLRDWRERREEEAFTIQWGSGAHFLEGRQDRNTGHTYTIHGCRLEGLRTKCWMGISWVVLSNSTEYYSLEVNIVNLKVKDTACRAAALELQRPGIDPLLQWGLKGVWMFFPVTQQFSTGCSGSLPHCKGMLGVWL